MSIRRQIFAGILAASICVSVAGCGARTGGVDDGDYNWKAEMEAPGAVYDSVASESITQNQMSPTQDKLIGSTVYQNSDVKLIRRASLRIQTVEFEETIRALEDVVTQLNGYYETAQLYSGSYFNRDGNRSGEYTVRVPAACYDQFMSQAGGLGYIIRRNESTEDVGEAYYDTEARLITQRTKQERLLALLKKAQNMEDIISLESALAEVEYQIEQYSSELKRYDSLIGYSTISVTVDEVIRIVDEPGEREGLLTRMKAGVVSSAEGLSDGVQSLLVWLSYNLFGVLAAAGLLTGGGLLLRSRIKNKGKEKTMPDSEGEKEGE